MPLIGLTSGSGRCRRLSANHCFVWRADILKTDDCLDYFIRAAMAGRFLLSQLHQRSSLEIIAGSLALRLDVAGKFPFWLEPFSKTHICQ